VTILAHDPLLVAASVIVAVLGGYVGLGLAGRVGDADGFGRRLLLSGAAWFLALGIWTMHFLGMLAAHLPAPASYGLLFTLLSFLVCALAVGVSVFFVAEGRPHPWRLLAAAVFMGAGIASMHYLGIHGLEGDFLVDHDPVYVIGSVVFAVAASAGCLHFFRFGRRLPPIAIAALFFGLAVAGMHYTAMAGMDMALCSPEVAGRSGGPAMSRDVLTLVVAVLAFVISASFLLFLVPERAQRPGVAFAPAAAGAAAGGASPAAVRPVARAALAPLGEAGKTRQRPPATVPVEEQGETRQLPVTEVVSVQATAHYTLVFDGRREWLSPWSIGQAAAQLDAGRFARVHRSHIVALDRVVAMRRHGDGALLELSTDAERRRVPVARSRVADVRARLARRDSGGPPAVAGQPG